jgi:outer membrane protein assembly factor BamB
MVRFAKIAAATVVVLVLAAAVAHWGLGYRVQFDGSGTPRLARVQSPVSQAAAVESHRAAQRSRIPEAPAAAVTEHSSATESVAPTAPAEPAGATAPDLRTDAQPAGAPNQQPTAQDSPYWFQFRGPHRDGHYRERPIRTDWPQGGLAPLWKQPVGGGYASFAFAHGRAFTIEQRRAQEVVAAYDVATGRELWSHAWDGEFKEWMGGDGPRATPTWADGRVYALGALGELRCLEDRTGRMVWRVNILQDNGATNLQWGMAASPLVLDDLVVVLPGGPGGRSVVAYDRATGQRRWSSLDDKAAYSSPMIMTLNGGRQILVVTGTRLVALAPESGELLWDHPWATGFDINASQPVRVGEQRILVSSAYGRGAAVIEVSDEGGRQVPRVIWEHTRLKNRFSSSVIHDGFIYGLDESILTCLDAETGEVKWKAGRYGHGQFVLASGHLVMLSEEGELALVRATPERHDELVRFPVLDGKTWNHPAIEGGILLVRNLAEMAAFDLRAR